MQYVLPFFPEKTKMINDSVGFRETDGIVNYFHLGKPIHCHEKNDHSGYRFILATLVKSEMCTISELSGALGISKKNVERYTKTLRDHGASYFFVRPDGRGQCYKITPELITRIQDDLDKGTSIYRTALNHNVSESAISYHIKKGNLKKKIK